MEPSGLAKVLFLIGLGFVALAGIVWLSQHLPESLRPFRLPGDIRIERDGVRFYLPITTMIILSLLATAVLSFIRWWKG